MGWEVTKLGDALQYEQPTKYIVENTKYSNDFETPVLTAGKTFLLGYTNEKENVFTDVPVIIFDDFTTAHKYVDFPFKVKSSAMKILKTDDTKYDIKFLYYRMKLIGIDKGLHKRYWISKYSQLNIPLPPLATQQKIAAILDEADKLRKLNKDLITKYDALTQSLFLDMFGDTWLNPMKWEFKLVEELALDKKNSIKAGPFGSSLKKEFYVESGYKVYGQEQVIKDDLSFGDYYIDENRYQSLRNCKVDTGDVLISLVGTYGKISVVPEVFEKGIINPRLMKISPNQDIIRPDFLKKLLQSSGALIQMKNQSRGGTMDIVNVGIMRKIKVPVPPIQLQNQFAERVTLIEQQKQHAQEALQKSEDLFNSLLQKVFKGELV